MNVKKMIVTMMVVCLGLPLFAQTANQKFQSPVSEQDERWEEYQPSANKKDLTKNPLFWHIIDLDLFPELHETVKEGLRELALEDYCEGRTVEECEKMVDAAAQKTTLQEVINAAKENEEEITDEDEMFKKFFDLVTDVMLSKFYEELSNEGSEGTGNGDAEPIMPIVY